MYKVFIVCLFSLALLCGQLFSSFAQAAVPAGSDTELRIYDLPILDFPYNNGRAPSMRQSLQISTTFYLATHNYMIDKLVGVDTFLTGEESPWPIIAFDLAAMFLPFGSAWMHEEWHRAPLGVRGVNSTNNIYLLIYNYLPAIETIGIRPLSRPNDI